MYSHWPLNPEVIENPIAQDVLHIVPGHLRESIRAIELNEDFKSDVLSELNCHSELAIQWSIHVKFDDSTVVEFFDEHGFAKYWIDLLIPSVNSHFEESVVIDIYAEKKSLISTKLRVGQVSIMMSELYKKMEGTLRRNIIKENCSVGVFCMDFVIITPIDTALKCVKSENVENGQNYNSSLFVGHRGIGSRSTQNQCVENTLDSFITATEIPELCNHIELDVQLTKDGIPVVYHDFFLKHRGSDGSVLETPLYALNYQEFKQLSTENPLVHAPFCVEKEKAIKSLLESDVDNALLESVLDYLPEHTGIMVEMKYPTEEFLNESGLEYPKRNEFVDIVLETVLKSALNRSITFLSFDATLCMLLRRKQSRFPVFMLNSEVREHLDDEKDPRTTTFDGALEYALTLGFDGMVLLADMVLEDPMIAYRVKRNGLSLVTYGKASLKLENIIAQVESGVDNLIVDDVVRMATQYYDSLENINVKKLELKKVVRSVSSFDSEISFVTNTDFDQTKSEEVQS